MGIIASPSLEGIPSKELKVVGQYGNSQSRDTVVLTETEFLELNATGKLRDDTYYLVCNPDVSKEQLAAKAIYKHYQQS